MFCVSCKNWVVKESELSQHLSSQPSPPKRTSATTSADPETAASIRAAATAAGKPPVHPATAALGSSGSGTSVGGGDRSGDPVEGHLARSAAILAWKLEQVARTLPDLTDPKDSLLAAQTIAALAQAIHAIRRD